MFCKNCGSEIPEGSINCPKCGAPANSVADDIMNAANQTINNAEKEVTNAFNDVAGAFNNGNQNYVGGPLKSDRSLLVVILLSIVTCGIYAYYFIYTVARDVNVACAGDGKETAGLIKFILLSMITCGIYSIYWYYALGDRLHENAPRYGMQFTETGTTVILWLLIGSIVCGIGSFIAMHIIIKNVNAICAGYNHQNGLA